MEALEILDKLESYIADFGCSNNTLRLVEELRNIIEGLDKKICGECIHWHSKKIYHPNWRECNQDKNPCLYQETHYQFGCNTQERK